ncbi:hypothetical protein F0M18_10795 [Pseudohalioglobus sediminis]|uniref:Uncharacterized protein n=1 Tax=Pseudohalioglobus sediminis TaxID=2606449 RepID=A0A5B0X1L1_9GAMM|nr:hypothetical protein [Pseudohalioglobus sediminis]KAA1191999.1 hypothetical protein F0M18_10795 [Pseudohalioglobus sediminis]
MKLYVLMTSLALLTGTAIGYLGGKDSTQDRFVMACTDTRVAVIYDPASDAHRHFHCFELESLEPPAEPADSTPDGQLVL